MSTNVNEQPQVIVSCEDPHTTYLCYKGIRFIFRDDEYVGWYRPDGEPKKPEKKIVSPADNILVGRVSKMLKDGLKPKEISENVKQPLEKIREIIKICKEADKRRKSIQNYYKKGTAVKDIAAKYGISESTVRRIIKED